MLRGGKALYGDASILSALGSGCSTFNVCTKDKAVCVDAPGVTFADIQAAATASYPLYFCKNTVPTAEPSCVPYRDTYPNGTSATDRDGDGDPRRDATIALRSSIRCERSTERRKPTRTWTARATHVTKRRSTRA